MQQSDLDVITFGEAMAMFVATECGALSSVSSFVKRPAGAELNVAIGLARLGFNVAWQSRLGQDSLGDFILSVLKKEKISTALVSQDEHYPTGFLLKSKVADGSDPIVEYFRKGSAASHLSPEDLNLEYCHKARHLHITGVGAAISESSYQLSHALVDVMKTAGKTVSFDPNLRPSLWKSEAVMKQCLNQLAFKADWFLPGIKEGRILTGLACEQDIADFYLTQGVQAVIIKLGEKGAYFKHQQGEEGYVAPCVVEQVVDTVGAGDGFAVGAVSALLEGKSLHQATLRGNKIGSLAIQVIGDSEGLPTREQLGDF